MIYEFQSADGEIIERQYPFDRVPASVRKDGKRYKRIISMPFYSSVRGSQTPVAQGVARMYRPGGATYPRRSLSVAVPARDAAKWESHCQRNGVDTKYVRDGKGKFAWPEFRSRRHEKQHLKLIGKYNEDDYC